jgi:hypothetical protein
VESEKGIILEDCGRTNTIIGSFAVRGLSPVWPTANRPTPPQNGGLSLKHVQLIKKIFIMSPNEKRQGV